MKKSSKKKDVQERVRCPKPTQLGPVDAPATQQSDPSSTRTFTRKHWFTSPIRPQNSSQPDQCP